MCFILTALVYVARAKRKRRQPSRYNGPVPATSRGGGNVRQPSTVPIDPDRPLPDAAPLPRCRLDADPGLPPAIAAWLDPGARDVHAHRRPARTGHQSVPGDEARGRAVPA